MGKIFKGILGGFSGAVGTIVGCVFRGMDIIKSKPRPSSKKPVQSQIDQRFIFALITEFMRLLGDYIRLGYSSKNQKLSPLNAAVQYNLKNAITGKSPNFEIDYSKMRISNGTLNSVSDLTIILNAAGRVEVTWNKAYEDMYNPDEKLIRDNDRAYIFIYSEDTHFALKTGAATLRSAGSLKAPLPSENAGEKMHVWLFFVSEDEKQSSTSKYLGSVLSIN